MSLLALQDQVVTREQALAFGLTAKPLRRLVATGTWTRLQHGVYLAWPGKPTTHQELWALHLYAGDRSAIGGPGALLLQGIQPQASPPWIVWVPGGSHPRRLVGASVCRDRIGRIARAHGTLRRIAVEDALLDVVAELEADDVVGLFTTALRRRRTTATRLSAALEGRSRLPQRRLIAEVLGDLAGIESTLEQRYRDDVERAHRLPAGRRQATVSAGTRSDVAYDPFRVLVELDGRAGHLDGAFRDMARDNTHATKDWITLRYGSHDVRGRPCEVAWQVAQVLSLRGWGGVPTTCRRCEAAT
ncbi:MAG: type IV toxin-antitoxin system AbiEi family antitoxin domain-containing protein [Propionibacteriaceae bacterium]|nr:type IV toxin-antitoxin system AbiEi family antitoxin domain-containing protein [Propionibacteriaceae bacterium]